MIADHRLAKIVEELIESLQLQVHELEKVIVHIEQVTDRLPEPHQLAFVASTLASLHQRVKELSAAQHHD